MQDVDTIEQLRMLSPDERKQAVQNLYAGPDHPLFVAIKEAFLAAFPQCRNAVVFCGMASGLGPVNAITVTTRQGQRLSGLPKAFLGMPVVRRAEGRPGTWLPTGDN